MKAWSGKSRMRLLVAVGAALLFAPNLVVARAKLTVAQAQKMVVASPKAHGFPIVINPEVVAEVNRLTGTAGARLYFRQVLARLAGYREMIEGKLSRHRLPIELLAIPVVESGYQNTESLPNDDGIAQGAGLWMIVRRTARFYGLRIGKQIDERFNEEKSTEAATRYLSHLYRLFHSWPLVLAAYNQGETYVKHLISREGTRDPWDLDDANSVTRYLNKTMAAAFILKNPELLD